VGAAPIPPAQSVADRPVPGDEQPGTDRDQHLTGRRVPERAATAPARASYARSTSRRSTSSSDVRSAETDGRRAEKACHHSPSARLVRSWSSRRRWRQRQAHSQARTASR
jgi:hypothetical protein